jgi:hypothetical protein
MKKLRLPSWPKLAGLAVIVILVAVATVVIYRLLTAQSNPIPAALQKQLSFSPFVIPTGTKGYTTRNYKLSTVEGTTQLLTYSILTPANQTISLSEYTQPPQFNEIPNYKDQFLSGVAQQYDTVQTTNGSIDLGHLARSGNKPVAIMLERGLLVFMSPDKDMSNTQWHQLGDQLVIQRSDH